MEVCSSKSERARCWAIIKTGAGPTKKLWVGSGVGCSVVVQFFGYSLLAWACPWRGAPFNARPPLTAHEVQLRDIISQLAFQGIRPNILAPREYPPVETEYRCFHNLLWPKRCPKSLLLRKRRGDLGTSCTMQRGMVPPSVRLLFCRAGRSTSIKATQMAGPHSCWPSL